MANRVYSNAFFHYTHNFEFVKNILEDGDSKFSSVVKRSIHQRSVLCILVFQLFAFVIYRFRI